MFNIKAVAISALIAASALAGAATSAQADSIRLGVYDDDVRVGVEFGEPRRSHHDGYEEIEDRRGWGRDRDWDRRGDRHGRKCSPWRAEAKAEDMGLRRAQVVDVDWNRIVVKGRKWGERRTIIFGRAPHCPVRATR